MREQRQVEAKINSDEKNKGHNRSFVDRNISSPVTDLMKRCGSPMAQYSHIQPRVFSHLPEDKRPRQLSKSPTPEKSHKPFLNDLGSVKKERKVLNSCKSNKSFKPKFRKALIQHMVSPGALTNNSRDSSRVNETSILTSSPPSILGRSRLSSRKQESNKFGFSTKQYKKLQIIKSCRPINLKLIVGLNRLKYTKFNYFVLKAFLELISIVHEKEEIDTPDWESVISYINKNQSMLLIDINNTPTK